ncbi:hypothetical protein [Christiangramia aquimixticola]|uniref:hypothetical protein n=1 Tax=Christiangramia aquimixticola TaxID=1697558 RepID=UPI003AA7C657
MKKFIVLVLALGMAVGSFAQVIQLDETRLNFDPTAEIVFEDYQNGVVKVKEKYAAQFQGDAIKFMIRNFDIQRFIQEANVNAGDIVVTVKSSKGQLSASYDLDGNLLETSQRFTNINLPPSIRNQVYGNYQGWTMTKNKYMAFGKQDRIDKEKYIVILEKGNDRERVKIIPAQYNSGVASIEKF